MPFLSATLQEAAGNREELPEFPPLLVQKGWEKLLVLSHLCLSPPPMFYCLTSWGLWWAQMVMHKAKSLSDIGAPAKLLQKIHWEYSYVRPGDSWHVFFCNDAKNNSHRVLHVMADPSITWRRTNVQQLTCKMVWSFSFYSLLASFRLFELNQ